MISLLLWLCYKNSGFKYKIQDTGFKMQEIQDAGFRIQDFVYLASGIVDTGYRIQDSGDKIPCI
jgi:hypothetical protein